MARTNPGLPQAEAQSSPPRTLSLRTREILAVTVLTLCVIVLTTVMHLYHTQRIVLNATRSQAEFVARQIYFQSAHALSRQPGKDSRAVLARDAELRALLDALALSTVTLQPIRQLAEDMERLRRGEFDVSSRAGPTDEFGKLAYQLQLLGKQIQSDRRQLLTERTQIQTAVDHLEDGVIFCGADSRILFANRAGEAAAGPARPA